MRRPRHPTLWIKLILVGLFSYGLFGLEYQTVIRNLFALKTISFILFET